MQKRARFYAVVGAVFIAGLILVASTSGAEALIAWINELTPREQAILRTFCLFVPVIVIPLGVALRRGRKQRSNDSE